MMKLYHVLFLQQGDCSCQAGLACTLTKKLIYQGQTIPVKQCMSEGMEIEVEIVDLDNQSDDASRTKRFLFNVRIFHWVLDIFLATEIVHFH